MVRPGGPTTDRAIGWVRPSQNGFWGEIVLGHMLEMVSKFGQFCPPGHLANNVIPYSCQNNVSLKIETIQEKILAQIGRAHV